MKKDTQISKITYFHPVGKSLPNGSHYQRGGFLNECKHNENSFILSDERLKFSSQINDDTSEYNNLTHSDCADYKGGIIVFSHEVKDEQLSDDSIIETLNQTLSSYYQQKNNLLTSVTNKFNRQETHCEVGAKALGKFFKGRYISNNNKIFDENSISIKLNGISSKTLLSVMKLICIELRQEIIAKDLNNNNIYLAGGNVSKEKV